MNPMAYVRPAPAWPHAALVACCFVAVFVALWPAGSAGAPGARSAGSHRPKGSRPGDGGPSRVVFPEQQLPLKFSHKKHVSGLNLGCTTCHETAVTSKESRDVLLPAPTRCDVCHGTNHQDLLRVKRDPSNASSACSVCHTGTLVAADPPVIEGVTIPPPNLKFNHAVHANANVGCGECHGAVERVDLATRDQLPRMRGCISCHTGTRSVAGDTSRPSGACSTCHVTEPNGLLQTEFASGQLSPPQWMRGAQHGPDWLERHKRVAAADSQFCANCHSESDCAECHDGRVRPRNVHPNDYLSLHSVEARQNGASCSSCHRQQSFCLSCHQRSGVAESGPFSNFASRGRFHPPKWVWTNAPRSAPHHAWEAQKNLNACTSCHVERDCVGCHATRRVGGRGEALSAGSGRGVNPHPPGFRARCGRPLRQNARACLFCHGAGDPKLGECR
jgi:hypothetical protein